ncbi:MAG: hypothetical protein ABFR50_03615 [Candidatus Fermentibacteria bacterium]
MKLVSVLLFVISYSILVAGGDGMLDVTPGISEYTGTDDVVVTFLQEWSVSTSGDVLGIDAYETGSTTNIVYSNEDNDRLESLDPSTGGAGLISAPFDVANGACFGVAYDDEATTPLWVTSDWNSTNNFCSNDLATWFTHPDPAGIMGRGMAHDGTDFWIAEYYYNVYRFQPGGSSTSYATTEPSTGMSGLAAFEYDGDIMLVITSYQTLNFFFYVFDGSNLSFLGSAPCPGTVYRSYGIAHSALRGTLFWSYAPTSGGYRIAELDFSTTALQRTTWGEVKTLFD